MGVIDLRKVSDVYLKLGRIYERVMGVIDAFHPDELAIEAPFFGKNVQSMLKLGRAQGVVIAAAIARQIPIHEYAPMQTNRLSQGGAPHQKTSGGADAAFAQHCRRPNAPLSRCHRCAGRGLPVTTSTPPETA